jgi:flagellar biosynthesis protein FlhF
MKVKTYVADNYQTAIQQAKKEMGKDAIILSTRQFRKGGFLGLFSRPMVEVAVAIDDDIRIERDKLRNPAPGPGLPLESNGVKKPDPEPLQINKQEIQLLQEMNIMRDIMADIKEKMYEVDLIKGISEPVQALYDRLTKSNVDKAIALQIASSIESRLPGEKCTDINWIRDVCLHTVQEYLSDIKPINLDDNKREKARVVVRVGPTGVGKTTTIAKLAANMAFIDARKVAFITLDTYRVSAAEQLRTFAEIIGVPIKVVFNPIDLEEAINEYRDKDIIFIDTAGRSPYNQEHMEELDQFMRIARPDETILVLSITTNSSDLLKIYDRFNMVGVDKLIFTKLDETNSYGHIIMF